jgi:catechol 2,3-dioxygenase-like lactoylglutathione lyase family enzyme
VRATDQESVMTQTRLRAEALVTGRPPMRLHHNAYVTNDLAATREFYEDVIGMPLVATWAEVAEVEGKTLEYCHCFFGLQDGSALAFFQFADPDDQRHYGPELASSPFRHIALATEERTQNEIEDRIKRRGSRRPVPSESTTATACRSTLSIPSWSSRSTRRTPTR